MFLKAKLDNIPGAEFPFPPQPRPKLNLKASGRNSTDSSSWSRQVFAAMPREGCRAFNLVGTAWGCAPFKPSLAAAPFFLEPPTRQLGAHHLNTGCENSPPSYGFFSLSVPN